MIAAVASTGLDYLVRSAEPVELKTEFGHVIDLIYQGTARRTVQDLYKKEFDLEGVRANNSYLKRVENAQRVIQARYRPLEAMVENSAELMQELETIETIVQKYIPIIEQKQKKIKDGILVFATINDTKEYLQARREEYQEALKVRRQAIGARAQGIGIYDTYEHLPAVAVAEPQDPQATHPELPRATDKEPLAEYPPQGIRRARGGEVPISPAYYEERDITRVRGEYVRYQNAVYGVNISFPGRQGSSQRIPLTKISPRKPKTTKLDRILSAAAVLTLGVSLYNLIEPKAAQQLTREEERAEERREETSHVVYPSTEVVIPLAKEERGADFFTYQVEVASLAIEQEKKPMIMITPQISPALQRMLKDNPPKNGSVYMTNEGYNEEDIEVLEVLPDGKRKVTRRVPVKVWF